MVDAGRLLLWLLLCLGGEGLTSTRRAAKALVMPSATIYEHERQRTKEARPQSCERLA